MARFLCEEQESNAAYKNVSICLAVEGNSHMESAEKKHMTYNIDGKDRTQTQTPCPYPRGLIPRKHAPRVPVQVYLESWVLSFPKAIDVRGGQAGGDADEHVIECEAKEPRVPAAEEETFAKENQLLVVYSSCLCENNRALHCTNHPYWSLSQTKLVS